MANQFVSEELRAVERDVDAHHLQNHLMGRPFAEACGHFLTFCEELMFLPLVRERDENQHDEGAHADNLITHVKAPIRWLKRACPPGGVFRPNYNEDLYTAAWELSKLGMAYLSFEGAFSMATAGLLTLTLDGNRVRASGPLRNDLRFEAYDRLVSPSLGPVEVNAVDVSFLHRLDASVHIRDDSFTYELNPSIVQAGLEALRPVIAARFVLPLDWTFPAFSLAEFRLVASVLWTLAFIHFRARFVAASAGCPGLGISRALLVMEQSEIQQRLRRYCRISETAISAILETLTYGSRSQLNPDPALQPIIPVTSSTVAISPSILLNSSIERNFAVLLNRMPVERLAYTTLSQTKEAAMRNQLIEALSFSQFRFWSGSIGHWGAASEVDLVLVSDDERQCLVLELKSFIAPAEPREIRERSQEILKGIMQIQSRMDMNSRYPQALRTTLSIANDYRISWAVVSETSIGTPDIQCPHIPVVNASHLVARLRRDQRLTACTRWLEGRQYLPIESIDYEALVVEDTIGKWSLEWWALKGLTEDFVMKDQDE
jgi:hypothetical protein